jgi:hypothetical protein
MIDTKSLGIFPPSLCHLTLIQMGANMLKGMKNHVE